MTTSLGDDMSEEMARQRFNLIMYNLIVFEGEYNYWPNPFNLFKNRFLDKITERVIDSPDQTDIEASNLISSEEHKVLTNLTSSVKISLGYLLRDSHIAFVYDEEHKNLFMILAEMNKLLKNSDIGTRDGI